MLLAGALLALPCAAADEYEEAVERGRASMRARDYATAAAAVALTLDGGTCSQAAVALTNLAMTPLHAEAAGQALVGTAVDQAAVDAAVTAAVAITDPAADLRGPVDYRKHVAGVMTRRAIETALTRAKGG